MHSVDTDAWLRMKALVIAERLDRPTGPYAWMVDERIRGVVGKQVQLMAAGDMEEWLQRFDGDKAEARRHRQPFSALSVKIAQQPRRLSEAPTQYGVACLRCGWRNPTRECLRCRDLHRVKDKLKVAAAAAKAAATAKAKAAAKARAAVKTKEAMKLFFKGAEVVDEGEVVEDEFADAGGAVEGLFVDAV